LVPLTPINPDDIDLLLQISPTSPDLGDPLEVMLDLSTQSFVTNTDNFGILNCGSTGTAGSNLGTICTPITNPTCNLAGVSDNAGTITLPGSCIIAGETFYFDEASAGVFADVSPLTATPEPSSLALLGMGLISVAFFSRRRLQA
jgi:hypothetical protein